jgi:4-hydroxy-2-oxoheptanedioate aldolase
MIYRNRVKEALKTRGVAFGTFIQTASAESAEIAAASGFDFITLDMEHGSFGIETLVSLIRAVQLAGSTPVVRLPDDSESGILKALDAGAIGILIPGISNVEQVRKVIQAAHYAPRGTRGACPATRATVHGLHDWKTHVEWCNQNIKVSIIIETLEGFENLEEILSVPGLDGVGFGQFDLAQEMGLQGQTDHSEVKKKIEEAMRIARKHNVEINIHLFEKSPQEIKEAARNWIKRGIRMISCMSDRAILAWAQRQVFSALAAAIEEGNRERPLSFPRTGNDQSKND